LAANASQLDTDADEAGDACDADDDNDGVADEFDNCLVIVNTDQLDTDGDGAGNACDSDKDGDGVVDSEDNCLLVANLDQADNDTDGDGDLCDSDDDDDGIADEQDNCVFIANADQANHDTDEAGDVCDSDDDNDTLVDEEDNCPLVVNLDQTDTDLDGQGDVCDYDSINLFVSGKSGLYNDWLYPYGNDTYDATPVRGLALLGGHKVAISASGCAILAGVNTTCLTPDGNISRLYRTLPVYSLIGAWSTSPTALTSATAVGKAFFVGSSITLTAPTGTGPFYLFLGINDGYLGDNIGGFPVTATPISPN
jgi:hypothetical protein